MAEKYEISMSVICFYGKVVGKDLRKKEIRTTKSSTLNLVISAMAMFAIRSEAALSFFGGSPSKGLSQPEA